MVLQRPKLVRLRLRKYCELFMINPVRDNKVNFENMIKAQKKKYSYGNSKLLKTLKSFNLQMLFRPSVKDQAFFAKRLSFLTRAGVPILESLHMIRDQTKSKDALQKMPD